MATRRSAQGLSIVSQFQPDTSGLVRQKYSTTYICTDLHPGLALSPSTENNITENRGSGTLQDFTGPERSGTRPVLQSGAPYHVVLRSK